MAPSDLNKKIQTAVSGLYYYSESEYPFKIMEWKKSAEEFRATLPTPVTETQGDAFFNDTIRNLEATRDPVMMEAAVKYRSLWDILSGKEVTVWRSGTKSVRISILVSLNTGRYLLLETTSVET